MEPKASLLRSTRAHVHTLLAVALVLVGFVAIANAAQRKTAASIRPIVTIYHDYESYEVTSESSSGATAAEVIEQLPENIAFMTFRTRRNDKGTLNHVSTLTVAGRDGLARYVGMISSPAEQLLPRLDPAGQVTWAATSTVATLHKANRPDWLIVDDTQPHHEGWEAVLPLGGTGRYLVGHHASGYRIAGEPSQTALPLWKGRSSYLAVFANGAEPRTVLIGLVVNSSASAHKVGDGSMRKILVYNALGSLIYEDPEWSKAPSPVPSIVFVDEGRALLVRDLSTPESSQGLPRLINLGSGMARTLDEDLGHHLRDRTRDGRYVLLFGDSSEESESCTLQLYDFSASDQPVLLVQRQLSGSAMRCAISPSGRRFAATLTRSNRTHLMVFDQMGALVAETVLDTPIRIPNIRFVNDGIIALGMSSNPWSPFIWSTLSPTVTFYSIEDQGSPR